MDDTKSVFIVGENSTCGGMSIVSSQGGSQLTVHAYNSEHFELHAPIVF